MVRIGLTYVNQNGNEDKNRLIRKFTRFEWILIIAVSLLILFYPLKFLFAQSIKTETVEEVKPVTYLTANLPADYEVPKHSNVIDRIIACESGGNPQAKNQNSTAKGLFQFLDSTFVHYGMIKWGSIEGRSSLNGNDNYELGVWVIENYGTNDWNESKFCWQ